MTARLSFPVSELFIPSELRSRFSRNVDFDLQENRVSLLDESMVFVWNSLKQIISGFDNFFGQKKIKKFSALCHDYRCVYIMSAMAIIAV